MLTRRLVLCLGLVLVPFGCDDDDGGDDMKVEDDNDDGTDVPAEGCADGDNVIPTGGTRACECPDGSSATQQCLASGDFGSCTCGGW